MQMHEEVVSIRRRELLYNGGTIFSANCIQYYIQQPQVIGIKDLHSTCSTNWLPRDQSGWLLLEIDNDFCIQEQQATVAMEMIARDFRNGCFSCSRSFQCVLTTPSDLNISFFYKKKRLSWTARVSNSTSPDYQSSKEFIRLAKQTAKP